MAGALPGRVTQLKGLGGAANCCACQLSRSSSRPSVPWWSGPSLVPMAAPMQRVLGLCTETSKCRQISSTQRRPMQATFRPQGQLGKLHGCHYHPVECAIEHQTPATGRGPNEPGLGISTLVGRFLSLSVNRWSAPNWLTWARKECAPWHAPSAEVPAQGASYQEAPLVAVHEPPHGNASGVGRPIKRPSTAQLFLDGS
jgi:hypothetical protein